MYAQRNYNQYKLFDSLVYRHKNALRQTHTPLQFLDLISKDLLLIAEKAYLVLQLLDDLCLLL